MTGLRDYRITGLRDYRTTGLPDYRTTGRQDDGTTGRRSGGVLAASNGGPYRKTRTVNRQVEGRSAHAQVEGRELVPFFRRTCGEICSSGTKDEKKSHLLTKNENEETSHLLTSVATIQLRTNFPKPFDRRLPRRMIQRSKIFRRK